MAHEPTREELITKARMREQLGPERQNHSKKSTKPKRRLQPQFHEVTAGHKFGVTVLPAPGHTWPEDWFTAYFNTRRLFQFAGPRSFFWYRPGEPMFVVRVVTAPIRKTDELILVERISDGFLAVIPRDKLYFLDGDVRY